MGKTRTEGLDDHVLRLLDGHDLETKVGIAFQLVSLGEGGTPQVALVSVGEVLACGRDRLRLGLWASSRTTDNLGSRPSALLTLVAAGGFYDIELRVEPYGGHADLPGLTVFDAAVLSVVRDEVAYAELVSGIAFTLPDADSVLGRWADTVAALRALPDRTAGGLSADVDTRTDEP